MATQYPLARKINYVDPPEKLQITLQLNQKIYYDESCVFNQESKLKLSNEEVNHKTD